MRRGGPGLGRIVAAYVVDIRSFRESCAGLRRRSSDSILAEKVRGVSFLRSFAAPSVSGWVVRAYKNRVGVPAKVLDLVPNAMGNKGQASGREITLSAFKLLRFKSKQENLKYYFKIIWKR